MATSKSAQLANFTQDILGRYICNGFDEAMDSMANNRPPQAQSDARLFNALIIGSFDGVLARHLYADKTNSYRILVLEAGRHSLPFQNLPLQPTPRWPRKCSQRLASGGGSLP